MGVHFKKAALPMLFRKLKSSGDSGRKVYTWFIDGLVFKVVYVLEAVVLVFTLGFFYLCCGCHI